MLRVSFKSDLRVQLTRARDQRGLIVHGLYAPSPLLSSVASADLDLGHLELSGLLTRQHKLNVDNIRPAALNLTCIAIGRPHYASWVW
jgi:hypothetical protein